MAYTDLCDAEHKYLHEAFCPVCGNFILGGKLVFGKLRLAGIVFEFVNLPDCLTSYHEIDTNRYDLMAGTIKVAIQNGHIRINGVDYGSICGGDRVVIGDDQVWINSALRQPSGADAPDNNG